MNCHRVSTVLQFHQYLSAAKPFHWKSSLIITLDLDVQIIFIFIQEWLDTEFDIFVAFQIRILRDRKITDLIYICRKDYLQSDVQLWKCSCCMNNQNSHEIQLNVFRHADTLSLIRHADTLSLFRHSDTLSVFRHADTVSIQTFWYSVSVQTCWHPVSVQTCW
jgi:hypothetical protein